MPMRARDLVEMVENVENVKKVMIVKTVFLNRNETNATISTI